MAEDESTLEEVSDPTIISKAQWEDLVAEHEALKSRHEALTRDNSVVEQFCQKLNEQNKELEAEQKALQEKHAALEAEHLDLKIKYGLAKKAYEYKEGDSKCPPVSVGGVCPECNWKYGSLEPHPVSL